MKNLAQEFPRIHDPRRLPPGWKLSFVAGHKKLRIRRFRAFKELVVGRIQSFAHWVARSHLLARGTDQLSDAARFSSEMPNSGLAKSRRKTLEATSATYRLQ
jgi:hypothetical protein